MHDTLAVTVGGGGGGGPRVGLHTLLSEGGFGSNVAVGEGAGV